MLLERGKEYNAVVGNDLYKVEILEGPVFLGTEHIRELHYAFRFVGDGPQLPTGGAIMVIKTKGANEINGTVPYEGKFIVTETRPGSTDAGGVELSELFEFRRTSWGGKR